MNGPQAARRAGSATALVFLALLLVASFPARDFTARLRAASRRPVPAAPFDPDYFSFLTAVARSTARETTVGLVVPRGELFVYRAAYELAPRRVLFGGAARQARVTGVYLASPAEELPGGVPIEHGVLVRR